MRKDEIGNIGCPNGHYVCDDCHGKHLFDFILKDIQTGRTNSNIKTPGLGVTGFSFKTIHLKLKMGEGNA